MSQMASLSIDPMSALDPGKVLMEFVTAEETCVRAALTVKSKEEESAASMAARMTVFSLVSELSSFLCDFHPPNLVQSVKFVQWFARFVVANFSAACHTITTWT